MGEHRHSGRAPRSRPAALALALRRGSLAAGIAAAIAVAGSVTTTASGGNRSSASLSALSLPTTSVPAVGCTDEWPMYQHDASHRAAGACTGIGPTTVTGLHPGWFVPTSQPVTASPTVSGGQVYVGDQSGAFYDVDATTGAVRWTFHIAPGTPMLCGGRTVIDRHQPSYGEITSSAAVARISGFADSDATVLFGAGGSVVALDAFTGACRWASDLDPSNPASPLEVESSPVVFPSLRGPEIIVGDDSNESAKQAAPGGVQALDARDGTLLWKYEPENNQTTTSLAAPVGQLTDGSPDTSRLGDGCGDVWSSPALDPHAPAGMHDAQGAAVPSGDGLVVMTTGNCPQGRGEQPAVVESPKAQCSNDVAPPDLEGIAGVDATTGCLVWRWSEPVNQYANPDFADGGDTDIGSSPILAAVPAPSGPLPAVVDGSKSGYLYALNEATGSAIWRSQPAQPGQTGDALAGAIGGFIGSGAVGASGSHQAMFGATAIPAPFAGDGIQTGGGLPTATPDTSLASDPLRAASLHAVDLASGAVLWQAPVALPTYAAVTYDNGVVFAPSTTGFALVAYDAGSGAPLWSFPTGASMSSGAVIAGAAVFVGAGTDEGPGLPPQANGIWCFTLAAPSQATTSATP